MSQGKPTDSEINLYAEHYVLYGDQTKAFRNAFPASKARAEHQHTSASLFNGLPKVQQRIEELKVIVADKAKERFDIDADWLLERLKGIDELDILDIMQNDMKTFKPLPEWPKVWRTSISGIDLMTIASSDESIESMVKKN